MVEMRYNTGALTPSVKDGDDEYLGVQGTRDGAIWTADWYLARAMEGRVFLASFGSQTTPLTAVAYDQDQPEGVIRIPTNTTIVPIRVEVFLESFAGTDNEVVVSYVTVDPTSGTSAAATEGASSTRSDAPITSNCTPRQLYTGNATITGYTELWRGGTPTADSVAENPIVWAPPAGVGGVLVGPAGLLLQIASTSTQATFYAKIWWVEFPSTRLS